MLLLFNVKICVHIRVSIISMLANTSDCFLGRMIVAVLSYWWFTWSIICQMFFESKHHTNTDSRIVLDSHRCTTCFHPLWQQNTECNRTQLGNVGYSCPHRCWAWRVPICTFQYEAGRNNFWASPPFSRPPLVFTHHGCGCDQIRSVEISIQCLKFPKGNTSWLDHTCKAHQITQGTLNGAHMCDGIMMKMHVWWKNNLQERNSTKSWIPCAPWIAM